MKNKTFVLSLTTDGPADLYTQDGYNYFTLDELLSPIHATVTLRGMKWVELLSLPELLNLSGMEPSDEMKRFIAEHVQKFGGLQDLFS